MKVHGLGRGKLDPGAPTMSQITLGRTGHVPPSVAAPFSGRLPQAMAGLQVSILPI